MNFNSQFLFFFSGLGAFNGFLLGLYFLFYVKPKHISNGFLGALLIMVSLRIWKSIFFFFNPELAKIYLQIGLSACFLIGPSLYFYLRSINSPSDKTDNLWKAHFFILLLILVVVGYIFPYQTYPQYWRQYFIKLIYLEWLGYIVASGFVLKRVFWKFFVKKSVLASIETWMLSVWTGNLLIWMAYNTVSYTSYIVGALSFSFVFYLLFLLLLFQKKKQPIQFMDQPKYADKKIEEEEARVLLQKLQMVMTEKELYKDPNLKMPKVAKELNIITHRLSQLINDNLGKSFPVFVNEYRVDEAKRKLQETGNFTIEAIGYDCGFNSQSTFYSVFKKHTGSTPAQYKKSVS